MVTNFRINDAVICEDDHESGGLLKRGSQYFVEQVYGQYIVLKDVAAGIPMRGFLNRRFKYFNSATTMAILSLSEYRENKKGENQCHVECLTAPMESTSSDCAKPL